MGSFSIEPDIVKGLAYSLSEIRNNLDQDSKDLIEIVKEIESLSGGFNTVARVIEGVSETSRKHAETVLQLKLLLLGIVKGYADTEAGIIGNTSTKINGSYRKEGEMFGAGSATYASTSSTQYNSVGKQKLDSTSDADKDAVIDNFEKNHPEFKKLFDDFLESGGKKSDLTAEDKRNIKYLVYTADEPFRSMYITSLWHFDINNTKAGSGEAFYTPGYVFFGKDLTYSYPDCFLDDPRGPYTTFFHECGHAIDDLGDRSMPWGYDTQTYKVYSDAMGEEVTIKEAIIYDVYYNDKNPHSVTSLINDVIASGGAGANGNPDAVIGALYLGMGGNLKGDDLDLYNAVVNQQLLDIKGGVTYEAVSDVYGGVSHNMFRNGYGHPDSYWNNKQNPGRELWAEFFAYNMAGDTDALQNLREYFPEAVKVLDDYADNYNSYDI